MRRRAVWARVALASLALAVMPACSSGLSPTAEGSGSIYAVATINAWGSILSQLGGTHVRTVSLISNPNADPHDYEPTPADARALATASLVVENGIGYDSWVDKALAADPSPRRTTINVGKVVGIKPGGNPHRWYAPTDVAAVATAITDALKQIDPADAAYFDDRHQTFMTAGLRDYERLIATIKSTYSGVPIGASESVITPLADALGLDVRTPTSFLKAISEGTDPSPADDSTIDTQIRTHAIKVYVVNPQNNTPDVAAHVTAARAAGIAVVSMTETLSPATASFQQWQVAQLRSLLTALRQAVGR